MESNLSFNFLVDAIYGLSLSDRLELKNLLEHNIADTRRNEIAANAKESLAELKKGKLKFSSNLKELKKQL